MGGSYITIFETTNYKWSIYENHSDAYRTYDFRVFRKKDDSEVERRTSGSWSGKEYMEFDDAFDELEKEHKERYLFKELDKEQVALSEIWGRMKSAESLVTGYKRRVDDYDKLFSQMDDIKRLGFRSPTEKENTELWRIFRKLSDEIVEGDYIGEARGNTNVMLNVVYFWKCFEECVKKKLTAEEFDAVKKDAFKLRSDRYGKLLY